MAESQSPVKYMSVIQYFRDSTPWISERIDNPDWSEVESAVRRMDDFCFPIVQLGCTTDGEDDNEFNVVGGNGRIALFHLLGEWQFEDPNGSQEETRLWHSDQGYFCLECNVLTDIEKVLRITREFYNTGSYEALDDVD